MFAVSVSTVMAATILGGPTAGAWVALIGTTEVRELRGRIPWYGTLCNHAAVVMPAVVAGACDVRVRRARPSPSSDPMRFVAAMLGGGVFLALNAWPDGGPGRAQDRAECGA